MSLFEQHREGVISKLVQLLPVEAVGKADDDGDDDKVDETVDGLDLEWLQAASALTLPFYQAVASPSSSQAVHQVAEAAGISPEDLAVLLKQADQKAIAWAKDRAAEMVGKRWENGELVDSNSEGWRIDDATRTLLRDKVNQALNEGWSRGKLAQSIESDTLGRDRAQTIAQTELGLAHSAGNRIGWAQTDRVKGRYVILSEDHDEPDECDLNAQAGVVPLDEPFPSGDDGYPFHPNCECVEVAVLSDLASNDDAEEE